MSRSALSVTRSRPAADHIPDDLAQGVDLIARLQKWGELENIADSLRVRREGGYSGLDAFVFFLYYFAAGAKGGLRGFCSRLARIRHQLSAVAGRSNLPSSAAISRTLAKVDPSILRDNSTALLVDCTGLGPVLAHPTVRCRDALGEDWHVFDLDGTVTVLRHRALPSLDGTPEGTRRSAAFASAGYPGRKRGDVQLHRSTLQHNGSGAWLAAHLERGNGDHRTDLPAALKVVQQFADRVDHPLSRCVVRADGAYGSTPDLHCFRAAQVPFVTRFTRPKLFRQPDVLERLNNATWCCVPDSGGGPERWAADLGVVTVLPGKHTRRADGSEYSAVDVRIVASRFARTRDEATRGQLIGDWQVELFAADLDPSAWPASDVVAAYFGRTAIENRFLQEDRELGLDRIFSYHLPGQEFASLVGLFVWNLRIALGFAANPPPADREPQQHRAESEKDPPPPLFDPQSLTQPEPPANIAPPIASLEEKERHLGEVLDKVDWTAVLRKRPDWRREEGTPMMVCPEGAKLTLTTAEAQRAADKLRMVFRAPPRVCMVCPRRPECLASRRPTARKQLSLTVVDSRHEVPGALSAAQYARRMVLSEAAVHAGHRVEPGGTFRTGVLAICDVSVDTAPVFEVDNAAFLPAEARKHYVRGFQRSSVQIKVLDANTGQLRGRHPLVEPLRSRRQHQRLSWAEHQARYALRAGTRVEVMLASEHTWASSRMATQTMS